MNTHYPPEDLRLLAQVVSEPEYQAISVLPRFAVAELAVLVGCYGFFALSTWGGLSHHIPYAAALLINAFLFFYVFTPLHDAVHRTASSDPVINDLIGNLAAALLVPGITTSLYRHLHNEHHRYTGERGKDPDEPFISAPWPLRFFTWMFLDVLWAVYYIRRQDQRPPQERRRFWTSLSISVGWHVAWLSSPWASEFLMYWLIPQRIGTTILVYLFGYIQHPIDVEQRHNPLQATRLIHGGEPMRLFLLAQSFHLMHHLFPSIPFYRYHRVWEIARPVFEGQDLVWQWPLMKPTTPVMRTSPSSQSTYRVRIAAVEDVAHGIRAFTLESCDGSLPSYRPGAHIDVVIAPGLVRQYSLFGDWNEPSRWRIAVKREVGGRGGSIAMHDRLPGDVIEVGAPRNLFQLRSQDARSVLVSGGIGITPILSMAFDLHRRRRSFEMHVCARNASLLPFGSTLSRWPFAERLRTYLDDGPAEARLSAESLPLWQPGSSLYLCGPAGFMSAVRSFARQRGWPDEAILTESFVAQGMDASSNRQFDVELRRSGRTITVPAAKTLLETLHAHHISIPAVCTQGICGACVATVLAGEVDHRDQVLGDRRFPEGCSMTTCVSRAKGDHLVLDL